MGSTPLLHRPAWLVPVMLLAVALSAASPAIPATTANAKVVGAQSDAAQLASGLLTLTGYTTASQAALSRGDVVAARAAYGQFDAGWEAIEDGVRARSRDSYRSIEDAMSDVYRALNGAPVDTARATVLLGELQTRVERFIATLPTG